MESCFGKSTGVARINKQGLTAASKAYGSKLVFKIITEFMKKKKGKANFKVTFKLKMIVICSNKESVGWICFVSPKNHQVPRN